MIVLWLPADTTEAREHELLEQTRAWGPYPSARVVVRRSVWVTSPVWSQEG